VKQENQSQKTSGIFKSNSAAAGIFLNIVLIMLTVIIVFLTYSLILNIQTAAEQNDSDNGTLKPSKIIQLEVLNGCGKEGIADELTSYLRANNFDVVRTGNYRSFDVDYSLIIDRLGNMANAKKVAEALGVSEDHIIQQLNEEYFLDVTFIIGKDYNNLKQK